MQLPNLDIGRRLCHIEEQYSNFFEVTKPAKSACGVEIRLTRKAGTADLPLHSGHVPRWLADRMTRLGALISEAIVHHYGRDELLRRLAHPFWFQSFGAVMGMDWHSSGITTSVIGARKRGLAPLKGYRGKPAGDLDALTQVIVALSRLADDPTIAEAEINPLIVRAQGEAVAAVDALVLRAEGASQNKKVTV